MIATGTRVCDANTDEWLEARNSGIGASEAAAACGMSPYSTPAELYHRKRGELAPVEETDAMRLGTALEPVIASEFQHRTGLKVIRNHLGLYRHADHSFMLASPDALIEPNELAEWKATTFRTLGQYGDEDSDDVPTPYLLQTQQQLAVTGLQVCHLAVLSDGRTLRTYRIERNDRLIENIAKAEAELWERIQNGDPPEHNWSHPSTIDLVKEIHGTQSDGVRIEASVEAHEWRARRKALKATIKELQTEDDSYKARLMDEIGEHHAIVYDDNKMFRRQLQKRKGYTVEPGESMVHREVNYDGEPILPRAAIQDPATA